MIVRFKLWVLLKSQYLYIYISELFAVHTVQYKVKTKQTLQTRNKHFKSAKLWDFMFLCWAEMTLMWTCGCEIGEHISERSCVVSTDWDNHSELQRAAFLSCYRAERWNGCFPFLHAAITQPHTRTENTHTNWLFNSPCRLIKTRSDWSN